MKDLKSHWEHIYQTKKLDEVSWYQPNPETSLNYIKALNISKDAKILDVGGGDSFLADFLLKLGYTNVSVLDISEEAVARAKNRLGADADKINWIVCDASEFISTEKYDLWHDRAAFHFLTEGNKKQAYLRNLENALTPGAFVIIGTFSENGPKKCSGIEISQYSNEALSDLFPSESFEKLGCEYIDHSTPSGAVQNFSFCRFKKKN